MTVLQSYAGYFTDPNEPYPRAGDLGYMHAVGANVSPCVNDAVGFEFFPPLGANLAISASNPAYRILGKLDASIVPFNVPNDANGSCSQTPSIGANGGYYFGYSTLPPDWYLEIKVPVVFTQQLFGISGPTSHRLIVAASSACGTVFPFQPVTVFAAVTQPQTLTVTKNSTGIGTVTSNLTGINCGATCSASFSSGSSVTLTASPIAGSVFSGWTGGGCAGSGTCTVTMSSAQNVTAQFTRQIGSLSVTLAGLPSGSVVTLGIAGPNGYSITRATLTGTGFNLSDVPKGTYTVTAPATTVGITTYNAPSQSALVNFGTTATINVTYSSASIPQGVKNDLNGDGKADLVWQLADGSTYIGLMNGTGFVSGAFQTGPGSTIKVVGVGDFNGDGKADLVWQLADGSTYIGLMNGTGFVSGAFQTGPGSTIIVRP